MIFGFILYLRKFLQDLTDMETYEFLFFILATQNYIMEFFRRSWSQNFSHKLPLSFIISAKELWNILMFVSWWIWTRIKIVVVTVVDVVNIVGKFLGFLGV